MITCIVYKCSLFFIKYLKVINMLKLYILWIFYEYSTLIYFKFYHFWELYLNFSLYYIIIVVYVSIGAMHKSVNLFNYISLIGKLGIYISIIGKDYKNCIWCFMHKIYN